MRRASTAGRHTAAAEAAGQGCGSQSPWHGGSAVAVYANVRGTAVGAAEDVVAPWS